MNDKEFSELQLRLGQVRDPDDRYQLQPELLCRHPDAVAGDNAPAVVDHHRLDEPEMYDRVGQQLDLRLVMRARVALRRPQAAFEGWLGGQYPVH